MQRLAANVDLMMRDDGRWLCRFFFGICRSRRSGLGLVCRACGWCSRRRTLSTVSFLRHGAERKQHSQGNEDRRNATQHKVALPAGLDVIFRRDYGKQVSVAGGKKKGKSNRVQKARRPPPQGFSILVALKIPHQ
jgi:hypothetical protein